MNDHQSAGRPPLIADVPVDEPPPYIPPLVDSPDSPAFDDDAPLWQS